MAKRKDPFDLKNVWKLLLGLIGIGVLLFALIATFAAFQQGTELRSKAHWNECIPRPACLDDANPSKRCTKLKIPNVCPPNWRPSGKPKPGVSTYPTRIPVPTRLPVTLYPVPSGVVQDCSKVMVCLDGGIATYANGRCQCPPRDL